MILKYIVYRKFGLSLSGVLILLSVAFLCLFGISANDIYYFLVVSLFVSLIFISGDYLSFRKKVKALENISANASAECVAPYEAGNEIERLNGEITEKLAYFVGRQREELTAERADQLDYYTMWLHQIKTPLSAMRLALDKPSPDTKVLNEELFKTEEYVAMALDYAKMRDITSNMVIKEYPLDKIIIDNVKKYSTLFIMKGLYADVTPTNIKLITDERWLGFVIGQILSNAVKYTASGGVRIYAKNEALIIEDSGIGIMEEDIPRIFEKGYTGYNSTYDKRSSGLGLYMARTVANALGIRILIESALKKGTRVILEFTQALMEEKDR